MRVRLTAKSTEDLETAPDLRAFADWVANSTSEDFLSPFVGAPAHRAARRGAA